MKKISVLESAAQYLTPKQAKEKFIAGEQYEADGKDIQRAAEGLYEAGKVRGWLWGVAAMGVAWVATSVINKIEEEFKADKG